MKGFLKHWVPVGGGVVLQLPDGRRIEVGAAQVQCGHVALTIRAPEDVRIVNLHTARDQVAPVSDPPRRIVARGRGQGASSRTRPSPLTPRPSL